MNTTAQRSRAPVWRGLLLTAATLAVVASPLSGGAAPMQKPAPAQSASNVATINGARLAEAAKEGKIEAVRALLAQGANIDEGSDGDGTALIAAARQGNLPLVVTLLELGATVDKAWSGDGNPLIAASAKGHQAVVNRLLQAGADVNAVCNHDETPLINASRGGHLDTVKLLVEHGADVNLGAWADAKRWRTPLNQAGNAQIRKFLIEKGARA